jgi:hypothetical protein
MIEALRWQPLSGAKRYWFIARSSFYARGRLTARHAEVLQAICRRHGHG